MTSPRPITIEGDSMTEWCNEEARRLHDAGWSYGRIGERFGVARITAKARLDPAARDRQRATDARRRDRVMPPAWEAFRADGAARLAEIPHDDRSPAQRLLGDPIFARSALAARSIVL